MYQRQVTYKEAVFSALKDNYCNFDGRASRSQYWWWVLFTFIVGLVVGFFFKPDTSSGEFVNSVVGLALFLPGLSLMVRRLHDVGRSGWWLLLWFTGIGVFVLLYWFLKSSDMYTNEYGPVPNLVE